MAERLHVRCPLCASLRRYDAHRHAKYPGIDKSGDLEMMVHRVTSGGRNRIHNEWTRTSLPVARESLLFLDSHIARVKSVLERLEAQREDYYRRLYGWHVRSKQDRWIDHTKSEAMASGLSALSEAPEDESTWVAAQTSSWVETE